MVLREWEHCSGIVAPMRAEIRVEKASKLNEAARFQALLGRFHFCHAHTKVAQTAKKPGSSNQ
jgi:hypothetical protein